MHLTQKITIFSRQNKFDKIIGKFLIGYASKKAIWR